MDVYRMEKFGNKEIHKRNKNHNWKKSETLKYLYQYWKILGMQVTNKICI